jgi:hypothetical protein
VGGCIDARESERVIKREADRAQERGSIERDIYVEKVRGEWGRECWIMLSLMPMV